MKIFLYTCVILVVLSACDQTAALRQRQGDTYFIDHSGDDANVGSKDSPWKTLTKLNSVALKPGDSVIIKGGQTFREKLILNARDAGTSDHPVVITSDGIASIDAGNDWAVSIDTSRYISISNLRLVGTGRKDGNTQNGLQVNSSNNVNVDRIESSGFQKSGVLIFNSQNIVVDHVNAHDNGFAGILITGLDSKDDCSNIVVRNSNAENNPGDPTILNNHSGNGILAGFCRNVLIEYCTASNNGWDMPRIGNGPVGIWAFEADSLTIQHCISFRNKTSKGGEDGGGFDLDGGVTNSVIQYCLSYENEGSAFGIFQYAGATDWKNNTFRFNISENDGLVSTARAGVYVWNGAGVASQLTDCYFYNNVIYNDQQAAITYATDHERGDLFFYNNIFIGKDVIVRGDKNKDRFNGNSWYSVTKDGGNFISENFPNRSITKPANATDLKNYNAYQLPASSVLRTTGISLSSVGIQSVTRDFNGNVPPEKGIGASF